MPLKNSVWLQEGEDEITPEVFVLRMALNTIDVNEGGEWSLCFDDDDMFGGHVIVVSGHLASEEEAEGSQAKQHDASYNFNYPGHLR